VPTSQSVLNYALLAATFGSARLAAGGRLARPWWCYAALALVDVEANFLVVKVGVAAAGLGRRPAARAGGRAHAGMQRRLTDRHLGGQDGCRVPACPDDPALPRPRPRPRPAPRRQAYQYTSLTSVTLLDCFTIPAVIALSYFVLGSRYRPRHYAAAALCVGGLALLVASEGRSATAGTDPLLGDALVVAGAVLYSISNVTQVRGGKCRWLGGGGARRSGGACAAPQAAPPTVSAPPGRVH
jgi:hypothetical protein